MTKVRCTGCGQVLAHDLEKFVEIRHGEEMVRIYGAALVVFDCERCGKTTEIYAKQKAEAIKVT